MFMKIFTKTEPPRPVPRPDVLADMNMAQLKSFAAEQLIAAQTTREFEKVHALVTRCMARLMEDDEVERHLNRQNNQPRHNGGDNQKGGHPQKHHNQRNVA